MHKIFRFAYQISQKIYVDFITVAGINLNRCDKRYENSKNNISLLF